MRGQPPEHGKPEQALDDDPFCYDLPPGKPGYAPGGKIVTGLSDEEDALRHIEQRFNPDLRFCPNCESIVVREVPGSIDPSNPWCDYCGDTLQPMGTKARTRKFDMR